MELLDDASRFTPFHGRRRTYSPRPGGPETHSARARQKLTGVALAPKNGPTLGELRCERPQMQLREIPPAVLETQPERALTSDRLCCSNAFLS